MLVAGGMGGLFFEAPRASSVLFNPDLNRWSAGPTMHFQRFFGSWEGAVGPSFAFLAAGSGLSSADGSLQNLAGEYLDPGSGKWISVPTLGGPPVDGSTDSFESQSVRLSNGTLQIAGGTDFDTETFATSTSWVFGSQRD
ncbi:MAG: hypothetical protein WCE48_03535 [Steroidobacteraceae bacterium]